MDDEVVEQPRKLTDDPVYWDWIPLIRVGPLRFGASKQDVQRRFELKDEHWDQDRESVNYSIDQLDGYLTF